jgi:predicted alpha/beta superfamily hydrolase
VEELMPFIDRTYRTKSDKKNTAIGGSSMGGLISIFLCHWHPKIFGKCMAMSPSLWWDRDMLMRKWPSDMIWLDGLQIWLDTGTEEGRNAASCREQVRKARRLAELFDLAHQDWDFDYRYLEVEGGRHNERDWGGRLGGVLEYFFGGKAVHKSSQ